MATKRPSPNQKSSNYSNLELSSLLSTYKEINSSLSLPYPPTNEFRSINDALNAFVSLSKILASKLQEYSSRSANSVLQEQLEALKLKSIDEVIAT